MRARLLSRESGIDVIQPDRRRSLIGTPFPNVWPEYGQESPETLR